LRKGLEAGEGVRNADRDVQDEMVIRYLQAQYTRLEQYYEQEMRELEIRIRHRIHGYTRACLETIGLEVRGEYKVIMTQFDLFKQKELE
jgi:hypothetical protein